MILFDGINLLKKKTRKKKLQLAQFHVTVVPKLDPENGPYFGGRPSHEFEILDNFLNIFTKRITLKSIFDNNMKLVAFPIPLRFNLYSL